jgi:hypothetical protein
MKKLFSLEAFDDLPKNVIPRKPATKAEIKKAEEELGLKFAEDYKKYLLKYGALTCDGTELTGITKVKHLNVVLATKEEWEYNTNVPHTYYLIENPAIDAILIWQDSSGSIYKTIATGKPKKIANSLEEYLEPR